MERFDALVFPGSLTEPDEGDRVRIYWDKGGGAERLWLQGFVGRKVKDELSGMVQLWGYDDSFTTFQSSLGNQREWPTRTPHYILTNATGGLEERTGLRFNAQNGAVFVFGTTAPNAIHAANTGNTLSFRAHAGNLLLGISRLCEQASHGAGPTYGLEWFFDRDGADAVRLNVVTRRQRLAAYTKDAFTIGDDLHKVPSETDREQDFNRILVVGRGFGAERVESGWIGAGTRELVFADKNVIATATAVNLANRIKNAMNQGSTVRFIADTYRHDLATNVGDDIDVTAVGGGAPATYRCFGIAYRWSLDRFQLEIGRTRRFWDGYLRDVNRSFDALNLHTQDVITLEDAAASGYQHLAANTTVVAGAGITLISDTTIPANFGLSRGYWVLFRYALAAAPSRGIVQSHTHTYDKANTPTGTQSLVVLTADSGNAGVDPHGHGVSPEPHSHTVAHTTTASSATAPSVTDRLGPLKVLVRAKHAASGATKPLLHMPFPAPHLTGFQWALSGAYPFAVKLDDGVGGTTHNWDTLELLIDNQGDIDVQFAAGSAVDPLTGTNFEVFKYPIE